MKWILLLFVLVNVCCVPVHAHKTDVDTAYETHDIKKDFLSLVKYVKKHKQLKPFLSDVAGIAHIDKTMEVLLEDESNENIAKVILLDKSNNEAIVNFMEKYKSAHNIDVDVKNGGKK
jgi:hypothetical protein